MNVIWMRSSLDKVTFIESEFYVERAKINSHVLNVQPLDLNCPFLSPEDYSRP